MLPNWIKTFRRRWIGSRNTYRHEPIRLNLQPLEDRTVPTLASPPTQFLATNNTLRAIANPDFNADGKADLAALGTDGTFTVALNDGNNGWTSVTSTSLGRTDVWGVSFGLLDADLYTDCVIQTSDGVMIGRGDGQGRLTNWRTQNLGAAGSFAGVSGARVDPAIGSLGNDLFADIVAVAPATNEFIVLRGDGTGEFGTPVRYASEGVSPATAWIGNFVGEGTNDVAVGHRDGTLTIFAGAADGSLTRSATTVSGLGTVTGLSAADVNGDGEFDLVVSGIDRVNVLLNRRDPAPIPAIRNGDFSQGLTAWTTTSGTVGAGGGYAEFREDATALLSSIRQTFTVPTGARQLVFDLTNYGLETASGIPDAFEASLLGADNRPLVSTFRSGASSFFQLNPDKTVGLADGVTFDGRRVTLDLTALPTGSSATLVFHLAGETTSRSSVVGIDNVAVTVAAERDDGFDTIPLPGPFAAATGVATGDVDGDGRVDVAVADGNRYLVFNRTATGIYTREETAVSGATAVSIAPLTAADTIADLSVLVTGGVWTPLVRRNGGPLDQAPRLTAFPDVSGTEGTALTITAIFTDADAGAPYTATIDWGDGNSTAGTVTYSNGTGTVAGTHVYADNGSYRVRVTVRSVNSGPIDFRDATATVANAAPMLSTTDVVTVVGSDAELALGSFTDLGFSAADLRSRETFLARIDWGDGSTLRPFARLSVSNGSDATPSTGDLFGSHRYTAVGVYSVTVTLTDDDGGEIVRSLLVTVRPPVTDSGVWWVPGVIGTTVQAQFDYLPSVTGYLNELAYFPVDDSRGRIGTLLPADPGYAAAAIGRLSDPALFTQQDRPGAAAYRTFNAGQFLAFAVIKNGTLSSLRANNPTGTLANDPLVWLSTAAANADGGYQHFRRTDQAGGWVEYASEDMNSGGDEDFNDMVFRIGPVRPDPVVQSIGSMDGKEGTAVQFSATVNSPNGAIGLTANILWGDGSSQSAPVVLENGRAVVSANHTYADNGVYTVTLIVTDADGRSVTRTTTATIANTPPTLTARANVSSAPRQPLSLQLGTFTDPGFSSTAAGTSETFTSTVDWGDATGSQTATVTTTNGAIGTPTTGTIQGGHTYTAPGTYTVTVRIRDDDGGETSGTFQVSVVATAPTVASFTPPSSTEGSEYVLSTTFTDPDPEDTFVARIDWGDGSQTDGTVTFANGQGTVTGSHVYADNGNYTVSVKVTDRYDLSGTRSASRGVTNVAPTLTAAANQTGSTAAPLTLQLGTFSDPGFTFPTAGTQETFAATVNWGDGSVTEAATLTVTNGSAGTATTGTVSGSHQYATAGTYTVTVTVQDDDGGVSTKPFTATITSPTMGLGCFAMAPVVIMGVSRTTSSTTTSATTSDASLVITGTGQAGATVTVNRTGLGPVGTTTVGGDGTWRFDYAGTPLAAGNYPFTATQDAFGPFAFASGYSIFVQNNLSGTPDAKGRVAAGGSVSLSNFSVGQSLPASNGTRDNLIVGGTLTTTGGQVYNGNAVYGTTGSISSNTTLQQGAVRKETLIDFAAAFTEFRSRSDSWAAMAATGSTTYTANGSRWAIALAGSDPSFNVFTVDGNKFANASGFTLTAPASSTVLVNVTGTSATLSNFAFTLNGVQGLRVLLNYANATTMSMNSIGVPMSILAPRADVTYSNGSVAGTLVAKSLSGSGSFTYAPFQFSCPVSTSPAYTVTVQAPAAAVSAKFFVVGDGQTQRLNASGTLLGSNALSSSGIITGVTADVTGTSTWIVSANADGSTAISSLDADGSLRGTWRAWGVTDARDLSTNGTDIWVLGRDSATNALKVFRFAKGAKIRSGGLDAAASFALPTAVNPTGLVTDGWNVFVVDKTATGGRVFTYDINGQLLGSASNNPWKLDAANIDPSGIALNPAGGNELWVVDKTSRKVFTYANGRNNQWYNNGLPQAASSTFVLPAGLTNPEGIADPPPAGWNPSDPAPATHTSPSADPTGARDVSPFVSINYRTAYYNWEVGELLTDARVTNSGASPLFGPVFAVYDRLSNGTRLAASDGVFAGNQYLTFQSELGTGGLASGGTSSAVTVRFASGNRRFDAGATLLAAGNSSPIFTSTPPTNFTIDEALNYTAVATDPDSDPLTYSVLDGPNGLQIDPITGVLTWTPTAADTGTQTVTLQASDGRGGFAQQTFRLAVSTANHAPIIRSTPSNTGLLTGQSFDYTLDAVDPDSDPLAYTVLSAPAGLQLGADGRITWTAPSAGNYTVAVQVSDGRGGTAAQSFTLTVTGGTGGSIEGVKFRYFDGEGGAPLVGPNLVTNGDFNQGDSGFQTELISNTDIFQEGRYTVDLNPANHHPAAGSFGDHTTGTGKMMIVNGSVNGDTTVWRQQVSVQAGQAYAFSLWAASWYPSAPARIHVEVNGVQIGPDLSLSSSTGFWKQFAVTWLSGTSTVADIRIVNLETAAAGNDFCIDDISLGVPGVPNFNIYLDQNGNNKLDTGERSTITAADGSYRFDGLAAGNYRVNEVPQAGWVQVEPTGRTQVVTLVDGGTLTGVNFGNRRITPTTNHPPAFDSVEPQTATVGQFFRLDPLATDPDGEPLTYELVGPPAGVTIDAFTGSISWVPTPDQVGSTTLTVRARDGSGATADLPVAMTVNPAVNGFAITSSPARVTDIGRPYTYQLSTTATPAQPATFSLDSAPAGMTIDPITGLITWAVPDLGSYRITVRAADRAGNVAYQSYLLGVRTTNEPPVLTPPGNARLAAGGLYRGLARATDSADGFTFSVVSGPSGLSIDPNTGVILWSSIPTGSGDYSVTLRATDDRGATADASYVITLIPDTTKPDVTVTTDRERVNAGETVTVRVSALDDGRIVDRTLTANGTTVTLDANGVGTYTPATPGVVRFSATATDAAGNIGLASTVLSVSDPSDTSAPVVTINSPLDGSVISYLTSLVGTVTDANLVGYTVEVSRFGSYQWRTIATGTAAVVNGQLAMIDPTLLDSDMYTVRVTATDVNGLQTSQEVSFDLSGQAKIGNFRQEFTDLQIPLAGIPITVTRIYDSLQADRSSDFGFGWSLGTGYDPRIRETRPVNDPGERVLGMFAAVAFKAGTRVYVNTPDGRRVGFTFDPQPYSGILGALGAATGGLYMPSFKPDPGVYETLEGEYDGAAPFRLPLIKFGDSYYTAGISVAYNPLGYRLTTKDGLSYHFGQFDGLKSITDRNGVKLTFTRDGITSSLGTSIAYTRDDQGRITTITDPNGKDIRYEYDVNGDLVGLVDPVGTKSQYTYSPSRPHFMIDINNATGGCGCFTSVPPMRMEYDDDGRLVTQANQLGQSTRFSYDLPGFSEQIIDGRGGVTTLSYDSRGNILSSTDPLSHTTRFTYDTADNELTRKDPNGNTTSKTYDHRGNVLTIADALSQTTTTEYDTNNKLIRAVDAVGREFQYEYDPRGNLIRVIAPAIETSGGARSAASSNLVTEFTYTADGNIRTVSDPRGSVTQFEYAPGFSLPVGVTGTDGSNRNAVYDGMGRLLQTTDEEGYVTKFFWDDAGRLSKLADPEGGYQSFAYSGSRITSITDSLGRTNSVTYDAAYRRTSSTDAEGKTTGYAYDDNGDLIRVTDANGFNMVYQYGADRRVTAKVAADGGITSYDYDPSGNLISVTDPNGYMTGYGYDQVDRVIRRTAADGGQTTYGYDGVDNILTLTDARGSVTSYGYDSYNRVVSIDNPDGGQFGYRYDAAGNLEQMTDANGNSSSYSYDQRNRVVLAVDALAEQTQYTYTISGNLAATTDRNGHTTRYGYDGNNRLTTETDPNGAVMSYLRDTQGQVTRLTDRRGNSTLFAYDKVGRTTQLTDAEGGITTWAYDGVGNLLTQTDANGHATGYAYDKVNRLVSTTDALNGLWVSEYDLAGNMITSKDANGHTTGYAYDKMNRLVTITDALGHSQGFAFDKTGNIVSQTDRNGHSTGYAYDKMNRLVNITDAAGGVRQLAYDQVGNRTSSTDQLGHILSSGFDALNRIVTITDPASGVVSFGYDPEGNVTAYSDQLNRTTKYAYDVLDRLVSQTDPTGATNTLLYDANGNLTTYTDQLNRATQYAYDKLNRTVIMTAADSGVTVTGYDKVDNVLTVTDPLNRSKTNTYDALNRLTQSVDDRGSIVSTGYDKVGNVVSVTDPNSNTSTFGYDPLDRLVRDTDSRGKSRTFEYDFEGNRTAAVDRNGRRREFGFDALDRQTTEVWKAADGSASYTANYAYDKAGNQLNAGDNFSRYAMQYDALDRVIRVDNAGTPTVPSVTLDYSYDKIGNVTRVADNAGVQVNSIYDSRDQLTQRTWQGGGVSVARADMRYDAAGQRVAVDRFRDLAATQVSARTAEAYDPVGRLAQRTTTRSDSSTVVDYRYGYDKAGQLTSESNHGQTADYTYDRAGQIVAAVRTGQPNEAYSYDAAGNPTESGRVVGAANRLQSDSTFDYQYDDEGNQTRKVERATGEVTSFAYDYRNRLTGVERRSSGGVLLGESRFTYDVYDRLIVRRVNGVVSSTIYDGEHAWADYAANGAVSARYLFGDRTDELLARWSQVDGLAWALADKQGSIREWIDGGGALVASRTFDAFGRILASSGIVDRFAYQGREWESSVGLYQFRARWYDPVARQFVSDDPLGFSAGDWNTRRFVFNNPNTFTDPSGMLLESEALTSEQGRKVGAAAWGYVLGFLCGYLDTWFDNKIPDQEKARLSVLNGTNGAVFGAALGYTLGTISPATIAVFVGSGAAMTTIALGEGNFVQALVRLGCTALPFAPKVTKSFGKPRTPTVPKPKDQGWWGGEYIDEGVRSPAATRVKQDVYIVGKDGLDLGQLDVWEVRPGGKPVFIEAKDGTQLGKTNPKTGKPFNDPVTELNKWSEKQILEAGRRKATALQDGVATRGDKSAAVPSISEIQAAKNIRFEIQADTPVLRAAVEARIQQLRVEFPQFQFEVRYGVKP